MNLRPRPALILPLFFLSGAAALGYQMVWVRMFSAGLGHEVPSMLAVAAAFLGGMAVGAWALDRRINRSENAARWYGGLEIVVGIWGLVSALAIPVVNRLVLALTGPEPSAWLQWTVAFVLPFVSLLPATAAMGATLPAMNRCLAPMVSGGRGIGALYAANTFGAVVGTLGSVLVLMPAFGFRWSLVCLAITNLVCGVVALALQRREGSLNGVRPSSDAASRERRAFRSSPGTLESRPLLRPGRPHSADDVSFKRIGLTLFFTGFFGIGFEIVGVRVLLQVLENTIYTYAAALAVYLVGTAAGAACYQRLARNAPFRATLMYLLCGAATSCLIGARLLAAAPKFYDWLRSSFGESTGAVLVSEMAVAAMVFGLPTLFMGATFSHLVQKAASGAGGVGRAGALNTLGCSLAAGVVGVGLMPAIGTKWTLVLLALGYLMLLPQIRRGGWITAALPVMLLFLLPRDLVLMKLPAGAKLHDYREGVMASVAVVETADGHRSLRVNNRLQMGGTAAAIAERRQAHLPLLLHPDPKRALFLGPGTGITLGAAGAYPGLETVGVELVPEVRDLMSAFAPANGGPFPKPGIEVLVADARRFARTTTNRYDIIVADLFHPGQDGGGFLYTREHFESVRRRLRPGGLFCQWLPLHQLDEAGLRSIVQTFTGTFSQSHAFLLHFNVDIPVLALVGGPDPLRLAPDWFDRRMAQPSVKAALREVGLDRSLNVLGTFAAGPKELHQFAGDAPIGTDDRPFILFAAPRFTQRRDVVPHALLLTFLERCRAAPDEFLVSAMGHRDEAFAGHLSAFVAARDIYLRGLVEEGAGRLSSAIEAYLESAKHSLYFTAAYARCVTIIQVMAQADRAEARRLFQRLEEAQPAQPLGRQMLGLLFEEAPVEAQPQK